MTDATVPLAAIGLVGTILALVVTPLFSLLKANNKALLKVAESSDRMAIEAAKGNREAKQRNGHLGEQNVQITKLVADQGRDIATMKHDSQANRAANEKIVDILRKSALIAAEDRDFLTGSQSQVISQQTVEHQTVKTKETK